MTGSTGRKVIQIFASEISVIAKLHKFRRIEETFENVWKRTNKKQYSSIQTLTPSDFVNDRKVIKVQVQAQVQAMGSHRIPFPYSKRNLIQKSKYSTSRSTTQFDIDSSQSLFNMIEDNPAEKRELFHQYGKNMEKVALKHYENEVSTKVSLKQQSFSRLLQHDTSSNIRASGVFGEYPNVMISGRIDGINQDGKIIEVKNRVKKLYDSLHDDEMAQLQTYLYIGDRRKGELVQYFQKTKYDQDMKVNHVVRDEQFWNDTIVPRVLIFAKSLDLFMANSELQKLYLNQPGRRKEIIFNLYKQICH